jgi:hypothetical protein
MLGLPMDLGTFNPLVNNEEKALRYFRAPGLKITIFFATGVGAEDVCLPQRVVTFHIPPWGKSSLSI